LAQCKEEASDIIHAEGVRVDFPSSAPRARNVFIFPRRPCVLGNDPTAPGGGAWPPTAFGARQNTVLPRAKRLFRAVWVGHFWRAKPGKFSRVPKIEILSGTATTR